MRKETMTFSKAKVVSEEARQALLVALEEAGCLLEVGQLNADGCIITERHLERLHRAIDEAGLGALRETYTIVENGGEEQSLASKNSPRVI